jgi:diguanylate cyclase (GGDEF)-like protein/PAS domain S-box-containing protein
VRGGLILAAVAYLLVTAAAEAVRRLLGERGLAVVGFTLLVDGIYLAFVVFQTGGSESELRFLVYLHLIAVTLLASYRSGLKIALWHSLLFFVMFYAQAANLLAPNDPSFAAAITETGYRKATVFSVIVFWLVAIGTTAFSSMNERLLRRSKFDLEILAKMASELEDELHPTDTAQTILSKMKEASSYRRAAVLAREGNALVILAGDDVDSDSGSFEPGGLVTKAWSDRRPVLARTLDAVTDPSIAQIFPSAHNLMVLPLFAEGEAIGALVLEFGDTARRGMDRRTLEMLGQFAAHGALALKNAWLMEQVQKMADTDALTGLANRRTFDTALERELARAKRSGEQVTLLMLDVDHFKNFNDDYGHQAGDEVLRKVGAALSANSRDFDTVARYGGEEFAVIMPSCTIRESLISAERLRSAIATLDGPSPIAASGGVATYPNHAPDPDMLVRAADEALYEAKRSGRDRVVRSRRRGGRKWSKSTKEYETTSNGNGSRASHLDHLLENSSELIFVVAPAGTILYHSPSAARVLGYEPKELTNKGVTEFVHASDATTALSLCSGEARETDFVHLRLRQANGTWVHVEAKSTNHLDDPQVGGVVLNCRNVSDVKALEKMLRQQSLRDPLTGLANRLLFASHVETMLNQGSDDKSRFAVALVALDNFKTINELHGHVSGDDMLKEVAGRLQESLNPGDIVARFGGDEFAILLSDVGSKRDAQRAAKKLKGTLRSPFTIADESVAVSASVGIAVVSAGKTQVEEVLRKADVAMYVAKRNGKDRCEVYDPAMHMEVLVPLALKADLVKALTKDQLRVHYQPVVNLNDRDIVGVEALVRWDHPKKGLIGPEEFIPLAEETGLILDIGRYVLNDACRRARQWQVLYPHQPPLSVAVNLSAKQLRDAGLVADVARALEQSGLTPELLTLEITESILMRDTDEGIESLRQLKALGVQLAIDDFGTGYSSLSYLRRLPVDVLKIAKPFVDEVGYGEDKAALAATIVELAQLMDLRTIAEGIESEVQVEGLLKLRCQLGQGHLFAESLDPQALTELLAKGEPPRGASNGKKTKKTAVATR